MACHAQLPLVELGEGLLQIPNDVVGVLGADGQANGRRRDALVGKLGFGQLGVRGGCRVNGQALHVGDVGEQRENLQAVDEFPSCFLAFRSL